MRMFIALATLALAFSSAEAVAVTCQAGGYPIVIPDGYQHDRWVTGQEAGDIRFEYGGFVAVFDGPDDDDNDPNTPNLLAQPEWVAQEVHRYVEDGLFVYANGYKRPNPWYEEPQTDFLDAQPGVTDGKMDSSYRGEADIWNRGHMATRSLVNRISPEAGCNTHYFFNAVPQFWSLNQGEWVALERYTGALANKYGSAWAINGPIFYPAIAMETIGGDGEIKIPIPHAVFKVIIFEVDGDIYVRAFLFPQPSYDTVKAIMTANGGHKPTMGYRLCPVTDQDSYDFTPYVSSLSEIEDLTGISFFPDATPSEKDALNEYSSRGIWKVDRRYFPMPCGEG